MPKKGQSRSPQEILKQKITTAYTAMDRHMRKYNETRERIESLKEELRELEENE